MTVETTMTAVKTFGYIRVSSKEQNEGRQLETMLNKGIGDRDIYTDKLSGKDTDRPQYQALKLAARPRDTIVFDSITRLSRSYDDIKEEYAYFTKKGVKMEFINEPMLNSREGDDLMQKAVSDIILTLLSLFAETERKDIKTRQAEGIALAQKNGIKFGRPTTDLPSNWTVEYDKWKEGNQTAVQFGVNVGLKKATLYRKIKEYEAV